MKATEVIKLDSQNPEQDKISRAAFIIKKGGLVVFPTETVYGIAANLLSQTAIERLSEIKKRPPEKSYSLHIAEKKKIEEFATDIPVVAYKLIDKFWPGPLTIILKAKDAPSETIGIRMPRNKIALDLINKAGVPIVAPSANISGKDAPTRIEDALEDLDGLIDLALDAGPTELGVSSTVVDVTVSPAQIVREGAIKEEDILKVIRNKNILFVCTGNSCRSVMAAELLKKKLSERDDISVMSAGIGTIPGLGASGPTTELLNNEGIDVSSHKSQGLKEEMLKKADLILVMEKHHEDNILRHYPFAKERLYLLKEFAKINDTDFNIPDPMGKSMEFYTNCFNTIKECVNKIADLI